MSEVLTAPEPLAPVTRKCVFEEVFDANFIELIALAPRNPHVRALILKLTGKLPPPECATFEQLKDWVELNCEKQARPTAKGEARHSREGGIVLNVSFSEILGCRLCLPPELERELTVIEFQLPGKEELRPVLAGIMESAKLPGVAVEVREKAVEAASGLTTMEAENAFALSVAETSAITPTIIAREKAQAVKKNGLLEIVSTRESLDCIGGLDVLKDWLLQRRHAFSQRARDYGLPSPKGLLILGLPGTGKSLTAKATAQVFNVPLLKLDAGRIFAGLVGQSESNLRSVIQTAEAIAPCVLWIDEVEKGFSGSKSSGSTDGGTSARVFGSLLSWLQEKTKPVFLVATANDVSQLPPELLRKGRFDEMFFVDLPNEREREAIWRIVVAKHRRDADKFDLAQLARASEGLTGSEIEQVFIEALYAAFDAEDEPNDLGIAGVLTEFVPLSKLMAEQITAPSSGWTGR